MHVLREARRQVRAQRNHNALAVAQLHRTFVCSKLKEDATPPEVEDFLPHPAEWYLEHGGKLKINRATAIDILSTHDLLDSDLQGKIEPYLKEIEYIAQG